MSAASTTRRARISYGAQMLLAIAATVDSYYSRKALWDSFNEMQLSLSQDERDAISLIHRGLFRLFPFDPDIDALPRAGV